MKCTGIALTYVYGAYFQGFCIVCYTYMLNSLDVFFTFLLINKSLVYKFYFFLGYNFYFLFFSYISILNAGIFRHFFYPQGKMIACYMQILFPIWQCGNKKSNQNTEYQPTFHIESQMHLFFQDQT